MAAKNPNSNRNKVLVSFCSCCESVIHRSVGTEDRRTIIEHEEHTQGFPVTNAAATNACILACYSLISARLKPNEVHTWLFYSRSSWQLTPAITRAHVRTSS